jgi:hypothetical protein
MNEMGLGNKVRIFLLKKTNFYDAQIIFFFLMRASKNLLLPGKGNILSQKGFLNYATLYCLRHGFSFGMDMQLLINITDMATNGINADKTGISPGYPFL